MAMDPGDADCTTGLSKRIFDYWTADARNGFVDPLTGAAKDAVKAHCFAVARAVVDELAANAEVTVTITTSNDGLQKSTAVGDPTDAPDADKTLSGTVS